jgi:hypothetical protein
MNRRMIAGALAVMGSMGVAGTIAGSGESLGPPLICFPYVIGDARSLPWGNDPFTGASGYERKRVVPDTLDILKTEPSVLVRMETMRRAAVYLDDDKAGAQELLSKISWKAMDEVANAEQSGKSANNLSWFDAGYLVATYRQLGIDIGWRCGVADGVDGWAWVRKAMATAGENPEMEFAAALMLVENRGDGAYKDHLVKAVNGAPPGSNLARSIETNGVFGGKKLEELKKELDARRSTQTGR